MDLAWIVVSLTGWALALVFVLLLMRMAGQQDRAARRSERKLDPFSDVTITRIDESGFATAYGDGLAEGTCRTDVSRASAVGGGAETPKTSPDVIPEDVRCAIPKAAD